MNAQSPINLLDQLRAPFSPERVSWRVGTTTADKKRGLAFPYIDARDVMGRLDDVCGAGGWQNRYSHAEGSKTVCDIGIKIDGEWIWKSDGAGDSDMEAEKGALSDAFKRAAVRWGIGRYLYDVSTPWVAIEQHGKSYSIADAEKMRLARMLAPPTFQNEQPADDAPTESERRIAGQMSRDIAAIKTLAELDAWRKKPENVSGFKDLPPGLTRTVQELLKQRREVVGNLLAAG